jgi:hypothetical protein
LVFSFPSRELSASIKNHLLSDNFKVIRNVRRIPKPLLRSLTEEGGSRLLMVNPGENYNVTDDVQDMSLPQRRLAMAGTSEQVSFVHYEQGGWGKWYVLEVFENTPHEPLPEWRGQCDKLARDLSELRSEISLGQCRQTNYAPDYWFSHTEERF